MQYAFISELARRNRYNLHILLESPAAEISGALGDLGTLLPLMIALALQGSINLPSTLLFSGLFNILTGVIFGIPLPVQPMKAIAASALATPLPLQTTTAAGALVSVAVLLLSATGALRLLTHHLPVPIIKGIQLGAGLRLVTSGAGLILPLSWLTPALDSRLSTAIFFLALFLTQRIPRFPYALILFLLGLLTAPLPSSTTTATPTPNLLSQTTPIPTITPPDFLAPPAWTSALAQLPLTTLNSIIAVAALATALFPPPTTTLPGTFPSSTPPSPSLPPSSSSSPVPTPTPPGVTALGLSVAAMNLAGCWFGAMPVCHGAGGLAAQTRFGARSGASVVLLGVVKVALGVVAVFLGGAGTGAGGGGNVVVGWLGAFPRGVLGVMVVAAGLELAKVGGGVDGGEGELGGVVGAVMGMGMRGGRVGREERWMVMMVTAAGTLAFRNDAVGFLAGCCCHGAYVVSDWVERRGGWGLGGSWEDWGLGERSPLLS
ncbi:hypothetical protein F5144DRAFT_588466 [Chaetomium tenue]|uniref:Uncharacterized protein n=1 Tax=Chaetomium tenue TaxID=1854479 RepID=A0ACB7PKT0_9PEZI|nr:hypothetical protein F5144DRAFT_588466 [Chaetomium globosum]